MLFGSTLRQKVKMTSKSFILSFLKICILARYAYVDQLNFISLSFLGHKRLVVALARQIMSLLAHRDLDSSVFVSVSRDELFWF